MSPNCYLPLGITNIPNIKEGKLAEILKRGKILTWEEFEIVRTKWKELFFSGGSRDDQLPYHILMHDWEDEQEEEE